MTFIIAFFILHWYTSLVTQSFLYHRYAAHAMFTTSPVWEKIFIGTTYTIQGSSYLSPRAYGILHRLHHKYTDTPMDPHSPGHFGGNGFMGFIKKHFGFVGMMAETAKIYSAIDHGNKNFTVGSKHYIIDVSLEKNLPSYPKFDRFAQAWPSRLMWGSGYALLYALLVPSLWFIWLPLLPIHWLMSPVHGLIINWYAHKIGYKNYREPNTSTNLFPIDPMAGEGLHNNHHKFPGRSNFANKWYEFDLTYQFIKLFAWLNIIHMRTAHEPST